jgi:hypothetical protein
MKIKTIVSLLCLGMLTSCYSYSQNNSEGTKKETGDMHQILHYASLAGSSHNSQPWKVEVLGQDSIVIYADISRSLYVVDETRRELYISIGAFIENLNVAAACYSYKTNIRINNLDVHQSGPVASIQLFKSEREQRDVNLKDIELRTTLRSPFDTLPINKSDWEKLVRIDSSHIHYIPFKSENGKFISQKELDAFTQQAHNPKAQDEFSKWIRFSNKDAKEKQDGLTTAGMGIKGFNAFIVRNFFNPEDSKSQSFIEKGIEKTKLQVENCGGWIVITQETDNIESWINTGRLYQGIHLRCRNMNLGFHPMNQIIEELKYAIQVNTVLNYQGKIMFVARVGYVEDYPDPTSVRIPVDKFAILK